MTRAAFTISVSLNPGLYKVVQAMARRDRMSIPQKVRALLRQVVEQEEDATLAALVAERRRRPGKVISHKVFWQRLKRLSN